MSPTGVAYQIQVIQEISSAIIHERDVRTLLEKVLDIIDRKMGMLRGTFALLYGDTLRIAASRGLDEAEKQLGHYKLGEGITGEVGQTGKSQIVPDLRYAAHFLNRTGARHYDCQVAFICVPILHLEKVVGTLSIDRPVTVDTDLEADVAFLEIVANIIGEAAAACVELHDEREALLAENRKLRRMLDSNPGELIGNCREMQQIYAQIHQVAPSDATVLIRGASGTGKEMIARAIVSLSPRKNKPFVALNCAALPEALIESELFGHEKGAFTGAVSRRIGWAESAEGGTLFLDEIGDLTLQTQVKLLRFIQERTFSRVGGSEELHANVRFLAATSRNLEELMEKKLFREDLYYRLNIFPINMPSLAQRKSDIILLAEHFIEKMNAKYNKHIERISSGAINLLMSYHWPGNVRELENCIERSVLTAGDNCIHCHNLPPSLQSISSAPSAAHSGTQTSGAPLNVLLENYERDVITDAIKQNNGNLSAAGRMLGLSPRMMNYRMNRLGLGRN